MKRLPLVSLAAATALFAEEPATPAPSSETETAVTEQAAPAALAETTAASEATTPPAATATGAAAMTTAPDSSITAPAPTDPTAAPADGNGVGRHGKNALRGVKRAGGKHHRKKH